MSDELSKVLEDDIARAIVKFCGQPKKPDEILSEVIIKYKRKGFTINYAEAQNRTARRLQALEKIGAISFDPRTRMWKSDESAISTLAKYYGV